MVVSVAMTVLAMTPVWSETESPGGGPVSPAELQPLEG